MDLSQIVVPEGVMPKPMITCVIEGHLDEGDLRELALSAGSAVEAPLTADEDPADLKRLKERHHSVARMIAGGLSQRMVAQLCGYTEPYLSILLNNPAMMELVELYRIQHGAAAQVVTEKLRTVGLKAIEKLEEQIDTNKLTNQELLGAAKLGLDRGGHGPSSSQHVVNETHVIDHAELVRRNQEARSRNASRIVSRESVRQSLAPPASEQIIEVDRNLGQEAPDLDEYRGE